ncbi:MAG: hypothetical protein CMB26_02385 [Euryarchaeota archaeon]|nr:hypothetical protein [Euryarchaeota archaeon]
MPHISSVADELRSRSAACAVQLSYVSDKSATSVSHSPLMQIVTDASPSPTFCSAVVVTSTPSISVVVDVSSTLQASPVMPTNARMSAVTNKIV